MDKDSDQHSDKVSDQQSHESEEELDQWSEKDKGTDDKGLHDEVAVGVSIGGELYSYLYFVLYTSYHYIIVLKIYQMEALKCKTKDTN